MQVATWNVNGIRARQQEVLDWIKQDAPDIVCLQEIKASREQVPLWLFELDGYWCYWHGSGGYSGVALHFRKSAFPEMPEFSHPDFDHESRIVTARAGDLTIASVYVPNGGKDFDAKMRFLDALESYVATRRNSKLILCGDLNVARTEMDVHPKERKPKAIGQLPIERQKLEQIIGNGLVDVGRALDPDNDQLFTWWAPWRNMRRRNIGWRLDYVLASEALARHVTQSVVLREVGTSDHAPVIAVFS